MQKLCLLYANKHYEQSFTLNMGCVFATLLLFCLVWLWICKSFWKNIWKFTRFLLKILFTMLKNLDYRSCLPSPLSLTLSLLLPLPIPFLTLSLYAHGHHLLFYLLSVFLCPGTVLTPLLLPKINSILYKNLDYDHYYLLL